MERGEFVWTPRFCSVGINAVYSSEQELRDAGFTEPTGYKSDDYVVLGKSTGLNMMSFAAARK
jgi:hypothetical protein